MNEKSVANNFLDLLPEETDLTMFTIQSLTLFQSDQLVIMSIVLKRKVATELLTTYLPTMLLLLITFVTIFFDKDLFGDAISVNLTIMLVMTTIFTSKIEELPPTSDMKMIDIWLIFCLVVPFAEVILRTAIECTNCSCDICEEGGEVTSVRVRTGVQVAPQQVAKCKCCDWERFINLKVAFLTYLNIELYHSMSDFGNRGKRGAGDQEGEPGCGWRLP